MPDCLHVLPAHISEQTGAEFFLEILHNSQSFTEINGSVASGAAFGMPAVNELFPLRDLLHLAENVATLRLFEGAT